MSTDTCAVVGCPEDRVAGSLFCGWAGRGHLGDFYGGRLVRTVEGYVARDALRPREAAWRTWTRENQNAKAIA